MEKFEHLNFLKLKVRILEMGGGKKLFSGRVEDLYLHISAVVSPRRLCLKKPAGFFYTRDFSLVRNPIIQTRPPGDSSCQGSRGGGALMYYNGHHWFFSTINFLNIYLKLKLKV